MSCEGVSDVADHPGGEAGHATLPSPTTEEPQFAHNQEQPIEAAPSQ